MRLFSCISFLHLIADTCHPLFSGIPSPEHPGNETIAGFFGVTEILSLLIHLMPREEAVHPQNGFWRERLSAHQFFRPRESNIRSTTMKLCT